MNWESGDQVWCCPFCQKQVIKVFHRPSFSSFGKSRGSGVSSTFKTRKKSETIVLTEKCPNCGKSKKEIEEKI